MAQQDRIRLEVATPEHEVFHAMVESFTVPAEAGSTGVLYNHAPLLTVLVPGLLRYRQDGQEGCIVVSRGFLEVRDNEAEILVASAELPQDIDRDRAERAKERAEKRLHDRDANTDVDRARVALARAQARLAACK